jgi:hypothetical protein
MKNRPRLSLKGAPSAPTTEPTVPAVAVPNSPTQEKTMEVVQEKSPEVTPEPSAEVNEPTAKALAQAEEENSARLVALARKQHEEAAAAKQEPVTVIGLAAQGRDALVEGLRQHAERSKPVEYIPPPRTARQMAQLEAELTAGRKTQQRAAEQLAHRPPPERDRNEGLSTPVHRPGSLVPDPTIPAPSGFAAGTKVYGSNA